MKTLFILTSLFFLCSCNSNEEGNSTQIEENLIENEEINNEPNTGLLMEQKEDIRTALENLMGRENADSFLIIEETTSGKFVQFAVNDHILLFDLPTMQFETEELKKTEKILKEYDILLESQQMYDSEDETNMVGEMDGFSKELGDDIDLAVEITEKLITEVFNPDGNIVIVLEEN